MQQQSGNVKRFRFDASLSTAERQACNSYGTRDVFASPNLFSRSELRLGLANQADTYWQGKTRELRGNDEKTHVSMPESDCRYGYESGLPPVVQEHHLKHETNHGHIALSNARNSYPQLEQNVGNTHQAAVPHLIHENLHGSVPYSRTALPLVIPEEPVYVNAKQYHGIMRRRQLRAKAELENKAARHRKRPYLHESRHLHALRRARGCGGRFVNTKKPDNSTSVKTAHDKDTGEGGSTCLKNSAGLESKHTLDLSSSSVQPEQTNDEFVNRMLNFSSGPTIRNFC